MFLLHSVGTGLDGISDDFPPVAKLQSLFLFQFHSRHSSLSCLRVVFTESLQPQSSVHGCSPLESDVQGINGRFAWSN